ncbi:AI-2E family transporter [Metabacillus sp. GX 13764]|uniref:AI-2E family transporter n=1 Tax=Metabacillus kandeliae TaxID=2900151 RepID=UPI001E300957|nr:AI-2E family transporter [Metabacillus kandeliae]MCD7035585.1 AI-2E family transporter [Metabacillus kandeliae]
MDALIRIFQKPGFKRFIIFLLLALLLYSFRSMINIILLTFIFSFLMDRLQTAVSKKFPINRKVLVLLLYALVIGLLAVAVTAYFPLISKEITQLIKQLTDFYQKPQNNPIITYLANTLEKNQIAKYAGQGVDFLVKSFQDIGKVGLHVFLSLILSLFFLLDKPRLIEFTRKFETSKIAPFYVEIEYFSRKFVRTFGKVLEAQFIIAVVNCFVTTIALWIMGFPQLFGISMMVLFLGLIPVAGVLISLVPLCIIAYAIFGALGIVYMIVLIMVIHAIEAYILNPKLMSAKTDLPVFYTFIVLIVSEHFFGVWGLIIGIPVFVFLLDVLGVVSNPEENKKPAV